MPIPGNILCFSKYPALLSSRSAVLAPYGDVTAVDSLDALRQVPSDRHFDLIVLCHTLSAMECSPASALIRQRWPAAKILALTAAGVPCRQQKVDGECAGLAGPAALVAAVRALLPSLWRSGPSAHRGQFSAMAHW